MGKNSLSTPLSFDCSSWPPGTTASGAGGWQTVKPAVITALSAIKIGSTQIASLAMNSASSATSGSFVMLTDIIFWLFEIEYA